jgi:predicted AlkP superfamily pyrophosphatase or phosphodiesterase
VKTSILALMFLWVIVACSEVESQQPPAAETHNDKRVLIFIIDGLMPDTARVAADHGAEHLAMVFNQGVTVDTAYSVSPAHRLKLPDGGKPWGGSSAPNVALQTGAHIFESRKMDDIFKSAREKNIFSIFIGGAKAYEIFDTADFYFAANISDAEVVDRAIEQIRENDPGLIRLHLQRIRDAWSGPEARIDPKSDYVQAVLHADQQLGRLIQYLKQDNKWHNTTLIVAADHGMGLDERSAHHAHQLESWKIFMGFYGPGIKRGQTIPYAESPDIAVLAAHILELEELAGHESRLSYFPSGATGTLLTNIFSGEPQALSHPRPIEKYLKQMNFTPANDYLEYRDAMIRFFDSGDDGS